MWYPCLKPLRIWRAVQGVDGVCENDFHLACTALQILNGFKQGYHIDAGLHSALLHPPKSGLFCEQHALQHIVLSMGHSADLAPKCPRIGQSDYTMQRIYYQ